MRYVRILDNTTLSRDLWTRYILSHPEATSDHCWEWRLIIERAFHFTPYYMAVFNDDQMTGVLPLFCVPRGFGARALVSIPFGNYGGICADSPEDASMLLSEAGRLRQELHCAYVAFHHRSAIEAGSLYTAGDKVRFSSPIEKADPEELFRKLPKDTRRNARYALRHGVTIESSRDTGPLYRIHTEKFRSLGTPCFPRSYFDLAMEYFGERSRIYYAYYKGQTIAFHWTVYFRDTAVVVVIGNLRQYLHLYPYYALYWHEIEYGVGRGITELDFGRSSSGSGCAFHKRKLGLRERPLAYQYLIGDTQRLRLRSSNGGALALACKIWSRVPLSCTRVLGPRLVRYFA